MMMSQPAPAPADQEAPLSIAQASSRTGVSRETLRYYERAGLLDRVDRSASGRRCYDQADLDSLAFLLRLRATGMAIREVRRFAELRRIGLTSFPERLVLLRTHRNRLRQHIATQQEHLRALQDRVEHYEHIITTELDGAAPPPTRTRTELHSPLGSD